MRFADGSGLTDPIVAYQGGLIRAPPPGHDPRLGQLLVHTPSAADARDVLVWTREHGLDPHVNHLERFILRADDPRAEDYFGVHGCRAELVPGHRRRTTHPVTKILAVGEPPGRWARTPAAARFAVAPTSRSATRGSSSSSRRASRRARRSAASPGGWRAARPTMAIGDQWNDLEMLAEVGHGAAMPTAPLEVRAVARYLARRVADEGVAAMIEALVLAEPV